MSHSIRCGLEILPVKEKNPTVSKKIYLKMENMMDENENVGKTQIRNQRYREKNRDSCQIDVNPTVVVGKGTPHSANQVSGLW